MIKISKSASNISFYSCQPKDKEELKKIILDRIKKEGSNCDLNDIDVSLIKDMSHLFDPIMSANGSIFTGDISKWNVSNVKNMAYMFANSKFTGDISRWDVSKVKNMHGMFDRSEFNTDISNWNVSNVMDMSFMFYKSKFNQDISNWKINKNCNTKYVFVNNVIKEEFKPKSLQKK